jgi:CRP-like cAMP-binding protein
LNVDLLKHFFPFSEIQDQYLENGLAYIAQKTFHKGDMIFKRGRVVGESFYLLSGRVDLIDASYTSHEVYANDKRSSTVLNPDSPTHTSCIAKSFVTVFSVETETLDRILSWSESAAYANEEFQSHTTNEIEVGSISDGDATDWMSSLLNSPLFSKIPLTLVQELFLKFSNVAVQEGEVVIKEGEKGDFFYVLASGLVHVTNHSASVDLVLEPGSYFGEEALLGSTLRNATITMTKGGQLKQLNSDSFNALLKAPVLKYLKRSELDQLDKPYKILDVKMPIEYRVNHISESINMPLSRLRGRMEELAKSNAYIIPNDAGSRADIATYLLCQKGFDAYILSLPKETEVIEPQNKG